MGLLDTVGSANPGTNIGNESPYVKFAQQGCFMYIQGATDGSPSRMPFDFQNIEGGLLGDDNLLKVRQAIFLNETGASIHMETTFVCEFHYEAKEAK